MGRFLNQIDNNAVIDFKNLIFISDYIKLTINNEILYEGKLDKNKFFDCSSYNKGDIVKLYIQKDNSWFYVEKIFLHFISVYKINEEDVKKYLNDFIFEIVGGIDE